jgi:hypothetical protein
LVVIAEFFPFELFFTLRSFGTQFENHWHKPQSFYKIFIKSLTLALFCTLYN